MCHDHDHNSQSDALHGDVPVGLQSRIQNVVEDLDYLLDRLQMPRSRLLPPGVLLLGLRLHTMRPFKCGSIATQLHGNHHDPRAGLVLHHHDEHGSARDRLPTL